MNIQEYILAALMEQLTVGGIKVGHARSVTYISSEQSS